jgi:DNA-binding transcriptional regulator YhcF (GntR family)
MQNKDKSIGQSKEIKQEKLIRGIKASSKGSSNISYGFILGAGASKSSDIPTGVELAKEWYENIKNDTFPDELDTWKNSIKFDEAKIGEFYTEIFEKRFEIDREEAYEQIQEFIDNATPSIGYSFLAQLLEKTNNKFVITTNFDTMTEDALFRFTKSKPLILGHELLSHYIQSTNLSRPTIIKIHRDFLLQPFNSRAELQDLDEKWQEALKPVLKNNAIIVIGYGGHDNSLMQYLTNIDASDRKPIYWCYIDKNEISDNINNLLKDKDFTVKISGFDEFMLLVSQALSFDLPINIEDIKKSQMVENALEHANNYLLQLKDLNVRNLDKNEREAFDKYSKQLSVYDKDENGNNFYERAALEDATEKVARYIDNFGIKFFKEKKKEVASTLAIAAETLSRRLKILEEEGLINREEETIEKLKLREYIDNISRNKKP